MIKEIEKIINYNFNDKELLKRAFIHKSYYSGRKDSENNERLEFLGDSVINLIVTEVLYKKYKNVSEGELSKLKSHLVSSSFLYNIAKELKISDFILLGKGELKNNARENKKIISSLFEALVGAIFLDSNLETVKIIIMKYFLRYLDRLNKRDFKINDYKSELQEVIQKEKNILPVYKIINEDFKDKQTYFEVIVLVEGKELGKGEGNNKRQAEQNAAFHALKKIKKIENINKLSEVFFSKND